MRQFGYLNDPLSYEECQALSILKNLLAPGKPKRGAPDELQAQACLGASLVFPIDFPARICYKL